MIGDVQSGKTATYLGVLNKAADAGYKVIVLLAGGTEALRKQTQYRLDEGLIGQDSSLNAHMKTFGVGRFKTDGMVLAQPLTTQPADFNKNSKLAMGIQIDPHAKAPYVFVLKKNKAALQNVSTWLREQAGGGEKHTFPLLLVDDESDYASVNTRDEDSPTVINGLIREILNVSTKSSYMAFTATPFANIFIDHETWHETYADDLFPADYIYSLGSPSNYLGAKGYFGTTEAADHSRLRYIEDAEAIVPLRHRSTHQIEELPDSLVEAIRTFIVSGAIREHRAHAGRRSMLVNVSRFKRVQAQIHELVEHEFARIKNAIELHSMNPSGSDSHSELQALRDTFDAHYGNLGIAWDHVRKKLIASVLETRVELINSDRVRNSDDMGEFSAKRLIAVGGNVLSRGLTLEGLSVSYYYRVVGASDTLLQMARWFGYRPGYDDLVRVWIDPDVADEFRYVADVVDELRAQLREMSKLGQTPMDFGLAVRSHPESLAITAKTGNTEKVTHTVSLAGRNNLETRRLLTEPPASNKISPKFAHSWRSSKARPTPIGPWMGSVTSGRSASKSPWWPTSSNRSVCLCRMRSSRAHAGPVRPHVKGTQAPEVDRLRRQRLGLGGSADRQSHAESGCPNVQVLAHRQDVPRIWRQTPPRGQDRHGANDPRTHH